MSQIKKAIQKISEPAVHNRRNFTTVGKIESVNKKVGTCSISYINNDGFYSNKSSVEVKGIAPSLYAWFPEKGDFVMVDVREDTLLITGPSEFYDVKTRSEGQTKKETLPDNNGATMAGMVF